MACTQILLLRWGLRTRIWHCFADGLNQSLVLTAVQATIAPLEASGDLPGNIFDSGSPEKGISVHYAQPGK